MKIRKNHSIQSREQYKTYPTADHLRLIKNLNALGFDLVKFIRTRNNYLHTYRYELKFVRYFETKTYEVKVFHDGYMPYELFWENPEVVKWLNTEQPYDCSLHFEIETLVTANAA